MRRAAAQVLLPFAVVVLLAAVFVRQRVANRKMSTSSRAMSSRLPARAADAIRLVIVSDTHRHHGRTLPEGDILIHCGDSELSAQEMDAWAGRLGFAHKVVVGGNMDRRLAKEKASLTGVTYLQDQAVNLSGLTIYGSPWTPEFVGVFQLRGTKDAESVWEKMPTGVDVLVTHGPPAGILDRTSRGMRVGDKVLLKRVEEMKPRVHCFGHIHESYGTTRRDGTLFCNAAVFNGHGAIVVDVPTSKNEPAVLVRNEATEPKFE